jgi:hypothetical protein
MEGALWHDFLWHELIHMYIAAYLVTGFVMAGATPFFLGACLGGIASGRVPYGNAKGDLVTSGTSSVVPASAAAVEAAVSTESSRTRRALAIDRGPW